MWYAAIIRPERQPLALAPEHVFWPIGASFGEIDEEIRVRIPGHHQLADAMLLDLAMRNGGRVATFDRRIASLVRAGGKSEAALEVIAV